jgi:hypothetical protein
MLEGGTEGDDPTWTWHLELKVCVVGDDHELCIAWASKDGMVGFMEPDHHEGEDLPPEVGWIF